MKQILNINQTYKVENHSYVFQLKTTAYYSIEFTIEKGFRTVLKTFDSQTGELIALKKGKFNKFVYQFKEVDGHIQTAHFDIFEFKDVNPFCQFIAENFDSLQLTQTMARHIYESLFYIIRANAKCLSVYQKKIMKLLEPTVNLLVEGFNTGNNIFHKINLDIDRINTIIEEEKEINIFKFRAECEVDVRRLITILPKRKFKIEDAIDGSHLEFTITTKSPIEVVKKYMSKVVDGHVMEETLAPIDKYTGNREYIDDTVSSKPNKILAIKSHRDIFKKRENIKRLLVPAKYELQRLFEYGSKTKNTKEKETIDYFKLLYYCNGMSSIDLITLPRNAVGENYIEYTQNNLDDSYTKPTTIIIPISKELRSLLLKYENKNKKSNYFFSFIPSELGDENFSEERIKFLKEKKICLRRISKKIDIRPIRTYNARIAWFCSIICKVFGKDKKRSFYDIVLISKAFGHSNVHTTLALMEDCEDALLLAYSFNIREDETSLVNKKS